MWGNVEHALAGRRRICHGRLIYFQLKATIMESTSNFPLNTNGTATAGTRTDQVTAGAHRAVDTVGEAARPLIDRAAGTAHRAVDSVSETAKSVQSGTAVAHEKIDAAGDMARPAVDRILTGAHQAVDKLSGLAAVAADAVSEKSVQVKEAHAKLMANGRSQVREKPAMAVGIAVVAGFILGKMLRSR
jgi:ElaB/YqjD/DUF883 family membrane-anchored ribosome-binding protein